MYVITNKKTGFKQYFTKEQFTNFYSVTGKKLINLDKSFSDTYSVKIVKEFDLSNFFYMLLAMLIMGVMTLAFIYYSTS